MITSPFGFSEREYPQTDFSTVDVDRIGRGYKIVEKRPTTENPVWQKNRSINPVLRSHAWERQQARLKAEQSVLDPVAVNEAVAQALNLTDELDPKSKIKFRKKLSGCISEIRECILQDIAPVILAFSTAHEAARQDLIAITQDENLQIDDMGMQQMMQRAARIKLVRKVASLIDVHPSLLLTEFSKDITIQELKTILDSMGD